MEEKLFRNSSIKQLAEESSQKAHKVQIANKLIDTMANLEQKFEHSQRRWIWELIQNAKDVCHENSVKINIRLKENKLEFSHTGEPFKTEDLVFLIEQTSSKKRAENENIKDDEEKAEEAEEEEEEIKNQNKVPKNTGKFGTGFITTHMLSRKIVVSGVWKGEKEKKGKQKEIFKKFELDLDRTARTQKEMINNINKSFKVFGELDDNEEIPDFTRGEKYNTKFKYALDQKGIAVAHKGLDDLQHSAVLTMLFNPQIKSLRVHDRTRNFKRQYKFLDSVVYQKEDEEKKIFQISLETFAIYECEGDQEETETKRSYLVVKSDDCACVVELEKDDEKFQIVAKHPMAPVIYADFPLIGSENFPFPFYVNSHYFRPNEPRSSLLMKGNSEDVGINKILFKMVRRQAEVLMRRICQDSEMEIINRHLLAVTAMPKDVDEAYYADKIQSPLRKKLFSLDIVENDKGEYTTLVDCMIPKADIKYVLDLYDLIKPIFGTRIIKKDLEYIVYWLNMFTEEWEQTLNVKSLFNIENLLDFVNTKKEIKEILERFSFDQNSEVFAWLNNLYAYLHATMPKPECDLLLNKYALIPNQNGKLAILDVLIEDEAIPEALKDVLFLFGNDIREQLIDMNIMIETKQRWDVHSVIQLIEQYYEEPNTDEELLLQTSIKLLAILPKKTELNIDSNKLKKKCLEMVCSFYEVTVEPVEIMEVNYNIWERAETFIFNRIIKQIEEKATVEILGRHLNIERNILLPILNDFYQICIEKNWRNLIKDRKIFPNQLGEFKLAKDLIIDRIEKDLSSRLEEENKYPENDMRAHMPLNDNLVESKQMKDISQAIFEIYRRLTGDIGLEEKLLEKSLNLENSRLFSASLGMREVSDRMEKNLQERRGFITNDQVMKKIVKDLQKITSKLHPEIRNQYFRWFEQNIHSIMVDTMSSEQMKSAILDLALSDQEVGAIDAKLIKKLISNSLSIQDIKILAERSKVKFPVNLIDGNPIDNPTKIRIGNDLDTILEKTVNEENNEITFLTNPAEIQDNLVNLNITSDEQFRNLVESKKIKFPANINTILSGDNFQYVLRILDIARKHLLKVLKENPIYDVSESFYDAMAPNQNVLMNVRKNNIKIHIVVRPSAGEKIIIHNEREVQELDDPNNELWFSNGEAAMQMTMGKIFRSGFRVINL